MSTTQAKYPRSSIRPPSANSLQKAKPVENADLWRELLELAGRHDVEWRKIPGHDGVAANERCHTLVHLAIQQRRGIQDANHQEAIR